MATRPFFDRVKDSTTTTGMGTVTLANSAPTGFRTFGSVLASGDTTFYTIAHQSANEWEVGIGTYTASGTTLSRTTVLASSNSNAAVNFSAGTKDVFLSIPAGFENYTRLTDTVANRAPASQAGRVFLPSDGFSLYRDTGSAWVPWGPLFPLADPLLQTWAWVNQGSATIDTTKGGVHLACASNGGSNSQRIRKKSAPATPFHAEFGFLPLVHFASFSIIGAQLRESATGKIIAIIFRYGSTGPEITVQRLTNATTFASTPVANVPPPALGTLIFFRVGADGTNVTFDYSVDGQNWRQAWGEAKAGFFTTAPDECGFFVDPYSQATALTLLHYKETA